MYNSILVTGGAGFIGSHVCERLLAEGVNVSCVDNFNDYYSPKIKEDNVKWICRNNKNNNFALYRNDITDLDALQPIFQKSKIDAIIHIAARAGVRASIENPLVYVRANVEGTLNMLEMARKFAVKKFIFASSSSVYGLGKVPFSEEANVDNPMSPYAATKAGAELLCKSYHNLYKIPTACLRLFTVYGPRGRPDMAPFKFMKLLLDGEELPVYGDGSSKRDYTYVGDIVNGIISALKKDMSFEIINLGNSNPVDLSSFISILERHTGKEARTRQFEEQKGDVPITYADISKARKILGWEPKTSLDFGIKKMVEWYITSDRINKTIDK